MKVRKGLIALAGMLLLFCAAPAVYADAAPADAVVYALPGTDLVGTGTKPDQDQANSEAPDESGTQEDGSLTSAGDQAAAQEESDGLEVATGADTADVEEIVLYSALLAAAGLISAVAFRRIRSA
jgi:hypothetical protein